MSRRVAKAKRVKFDAYPTPPWCIRRFLEEYAPERGRWLEPAAGDGILIKTVDEMIPGIEWTAADIRPSCEPQLLAIPTVKRVLMGDFLALDRTYFDEPNERYPFDVAMTNCPYDRAQEFIDRLRLLARTVILLLRLNFVGSAERGETKLPERILALPDRPHFVGGKSDSCEYGWFVYSNYISTPLPNSSVLTRLAITSPEERGVRRVKRRSKKIAIAA